MASVEVRRVLKCATSTQAARRATAATEQATASGSIRRFYAPQDRGTISARSYHRLKRDGYDYVGGKIVPISGIARVADVRAAAQELDAPHLVESIHRIESAI